MFSRAIRQSSRRVAAISAGGRIASVSSSHLAAIAFILHFGNVYSSGTSLATTIDSQLEGALLLAAVAMEGELFSIEH